MLDRLSEEIKTKENVHFVYSLFEELSNFNRYDYVFCSYVMEHVADPSAIIEI